MMRPEFIEIVESECKTLIRKSDVEAVVLDSSSGRVLIRLEEKGDLIYSEDTPAKETAEEMYQALRRQLIQDHLGAGCGNSCCLQCSQGDTPSP